MPLHPHPFNELKRWTRWSALLVCVLVGVACGEDDGEPAQDDTPTPPPEALLQPITAPGPFGVGYSERAMSYAPGFTEDKLEIPRTLSVQIWYPSQATDGQQAVYAGIATREEVFVDAEPSIEAPAPVLILSHGSKVLPEFNYFMTEYFASHGWVVVAPKHTGDSLDTLIVPRPPWIYELRPQDIIKTIDMLATLPQDDPLAGKLSDEDIAVAGYSFGGYSAFAIAGASHDVDALLTDCSPIDQDAQCDYIKGEAEARYRAGFKDSRVKAIVAMAPGDSRAYNAGLGDVSLPTLHITGEQDKSNSEANDGTPIWDFLASTDAIRIQIPRGGHATFTNACTLFPGLSTDDGCGEDFVNPDEAHAFINAYAMAFVRFHLWGITTDADLLTGERALSDEAVFVTR